MDARFSFAWPGRPVKAAAISVPEGGRHMDVAYKSIAGANTGSLEETAKGAHFSFAYFAFVRAKEK